MTFLIMAAYCFPVFLIFQVFSAKKLYIILPFPVGLKTCAHHQVESDVQLEVCETFNSIAPLRMQKVAGIKLGADTFWDEDNHSSRLPPRW